MFLRHSDEFKDIAAALCDAQGEFDIARKDSLNPHLKSTYADITSIKKAAQPALTKHKLALLQTHRAIEEIATPLRYTLVTTLIHAPTGQWFEMEYPLHVLKADAQGFAAATTYARRVSAATILGIVAEEEDDDGQTNTEVERNALGQPVGQAADEQVEMERRAKNWAQGAIEKIRKMNKAQADAWAKENGKTLARLEKQNREWFENLKVALAERELGIEPIKPDPKPAAAPVAADVEADKAALKFKRLLDDLGACTTEKDIGELDESVTEWITNNDFPFLEEWAVAVSSARRVINRSKVQSKSVTKL